MLFRKKHKTTSFTITVPEPCRENWDQMNPVDGVHRYCSSCAKNVVDFTNMSDDELTIFFRERRENTCGWFRKDQLNRTFHAMPEQTTKARWWKAALLLPFTLFSKTGNAQQTIGGDTIPVVEVNTNEATGDTIPPISISAGAVPVDSFPQTYLWQLPDANIITTEIYHMGGPCCITYNPIDWCLPAWSPEYNITVDVVPSEPPLTEAAAGAGAETASPPPKPGSSKLAQPFGQIIPEEKNQ